MSTQLPLTALVLCGGQSKRMGRPKAFLPFEGTTMIAHIVDELKDVFNEIFLVANEPEAYEGLGVDVVKDILPNRGPLGGILSGLLVANNPYAFVIACDMPLLNKSLVWQMSDLRHDNDIVVLSHELGIEPLLGIYSKSCIKSLEESLFAGNLSVRDFLGSLKAQTFTYASESAGDESELPPYFNINTPQDYTRLLQKSQVHHFPKAPQTPHTKDRGA